MKVVVYVPAADERALRAGGLDPAGWVRELVRRGLSERQYPAVGDGAASRSESPGPVFTDRQVGASVERIATGRGLNYGQVREPRPVTKVDKNCRNADYHWKLGAGEECKFCGGTL